MTPYSIAGFFAVFLSAAPTSALSAPSVKEGVEVRVHVPYPERLENERPHQMIVRVENRSDDEVVILTEKDDAISDLAQFRSQMRDEIEDGGSLQLAQWDQIEKESDLVLKSGQAIEMIGGSVMGLSLPESGESRLVFQVGPNELAYSNWVNLTTVPKLDVSGWPVVATEQLTPGEIGVTEFLLGKAPSGEWLFRRPVWNRRLLSRVCPLPGGEVPRIVGNADAWEVAVLFDEYSKASVFLSGPLGISKSSPWPDRHRGVDFIKKPMSVEVPSPLEFPMELFANVDRENFRDDVVDGGLPEKSTEDRLIPNKGEGRADPLPSQVRNLFWPLVSAAAILCCGTLLLCRFRLKKASKG